MFRTLERIKRKADDAHALQAGTAKLTATNLYVLRKLAARVDRGERVTTIERASLRHARRCMAAGALAVDGGALVVTDKGRALLGSAPSNASNLPPCFRLNTGRLLSTPGALSDFGEVFRLACLARHVRGDWGDLDPEDRAANDAACRDGARILSAYVDSTTGRKLWIITEADRASTTLLRPEDY